MATSPVLSATVLGKRNADTLVLHLASSSSYSPSDSEIELPQPSSSSKAQLSSRPPIIVNGSLVSDTKRRYKCTYEECNKAYTKPSRLEEHERSHTGQRPFVCDTCNRSYLRETHLQAHARSHLPESARPFQCAEGGCGKRFWTSQHLRVHEDLHKGEKPFKCTEEACDEAFAKHHQLRTHVCTMHAPPGTKPYRCDYAGCTKSFPTSQKLRAHVKIHDDKRYTCVHPNCLPGPGSNPVYYPTWTSLQHHNRTAHPPTCYHSPCNGKVFTTQRGLRAHQKLHEQREAEIEMVVVSDADDDDGDGERPRKKRRGGEIGRDWKCEVERCEKDFKSKQALNTHHNIVHLGRRDFVCPHTTCKQAFGYKKILQRHLSKVHTATSSSLSASHSSDHTTDGGEDEEEDEEDEEMPQKVKIAMRMDIDAITGAAYASHASARVHGAKALRCPYPHRIDTLIGAVSSSVARKGEGNGCTYVFSRAYDLRRHLRAEHEIDVEKEMVDDWVRGLKSAQRRNQ